MSSELTFGKYKGTSIEEVYASDPGSGSITISETISAGMKAAWKCGETYTRGHKARHEQTERHRYGVASEEERKNMDDAREEADYERKQALKARRNAPGECECGTSYPKAGKSHHARKSKAHLKWLADHQ
ncbi:unnamed protein product [Phytophthora lilii]|uniref:Unnamed protein product n=1 Tax=Phytophthora lilii TaxID=2077276 RepID=A0A9W7CQP1_9STRA|nr:unnamed protein product [Phytophthora lilii]